MKGFFGCGDCGKSRFGGREELGLGLVKIEWRCQVGGWPIEFAIQGALYFNSKLFQFSHVLGNRTVVN